MIWYFLYPFRGTTNPPHLQPNHPLRRAFYRLGTLIARHWLASIVFSVTVGVTLCYPSVFLYTNPTAGFTSKIPHHVWASARLYDSPLEKQADVEIRQVWVHGSYMRALDPSVLLGALHIQNALLADGFDAPGPGIEDAGGGRDGREAGSAFSDTPSWAFHSPLMYWNGSAALIEGDKDTVATVNLQSQRKSYMDLTLRPASVLAGKRFVNGNITAADALVITLLDMTGAKVGAEWERRVRSLAADQSTSHQQWYLPNEVGSSHLYEFEFKPMTFNDVATLLLCYIVMAAYVLACLRRTRAVKSTLGLGLTIITELSVSIIASLTICGILNIDLSLIPREVYPLVVFAIGLENMFRIMNAVVDTSAAMPTVQRIATALGDVGHLSLAAAGQNLFLLWALSKLVAPSVQAFCAFAAIALVVDFTMHLSFFIAVLSVDVQRLELQDSLDRLNVSPRRAKSPHRPERQTWVDALRHGKLPFTTRVAGTAVTLSFVIALNWHFFDNMSLFQMLQTMRPGNKKAGILFSSATLPPINAHRSPGTWLRMQNQQTAEEVIRFVKPRTPNFTARIHQPVAAVLRGADRGGAIPRTETVLAIIHDVLDRHLIPFALTVVSIVALTTILMNYLLWDELSEDDGFDGGDADEEILHIGRLWRLHEHDVIKVFADNHLMLSVSSDKLAVATVWDNRRNCYISQPVSFEAIGAPLWPINGVGLHSAGTWLAVYVKDGRVGFCAVGERRPRHVVQTPLRDRAAVLAAFVPPHAATVTDPQFLLLTADGSLTMFTVSQHVSVTSTVVVESVPLHACLFTHGKGHLRIFVLLRNGLLTALEKADGVWQRSKAVTDVEVGNAANPRSGQALCPVPELGCLIFYQGTDVQMFAAADLHVIARLSMPHPIKKATLRILHPPRRECPSCHGSATYSLSFAFTCADTEAFVMVTYRLERGESLLCFSTLDARLRAGCGSIQNAGANTRTVEAPGAWDATHVQAVIGIRKGSAGKEAESEAEDEDAGEAMSTASNTPHAPIRGPNSTRSRRPSYNRIRSRSHRHESPGPASASASGLEDWQLWTLTTSGEFETGSLSQMPIRCLQAPLIGLREHEQLFAATVGPVRRLGKRSVAVALANTIFTVTLGAGEGGLLYASDGEGATGAADAQRSWRSRGKERDLASHRRHNE